ncbi:hypothetical protein XA68_15840 [Ophiocordyceps unilateralis]|uniref:Lysyl-tRNA synthetase n=1 Tax=Ophiocordyceps unilateralis TaxID=268505 RepID=A0A2A9P7N2_OPHUN|nr:hypothetical protein XA68_15840 [Ophiocordyceps unilateralis]
MSTELSRRGPGRALATGPPEDPSDARVDGVSPYKRQREEELPVDRQSKEPLHSPHDSFDDDVSPYRRQREEGLRADRESEEPLYPETYPRLEEPNERDSVPKFFSSFDSYTEKKEPVTVMGRVRSKRITGRSLIFLDLVNEFQRLQVILNKSKITSYKTRRAHKFSMMRQLIQVGDHIAVTGIASRSSTGEPSLEASQIPELLAPALEPIPERLSDAKRRMRERHVDMLVNRGVTDVLRLRAEITRHMRDHFHSRRFLEMQTPILAEDAGGAIARPFVTKALGMQMDKRLALRIAPELWLKRLVVGGFDKVFEIGPAFRNEGVDNSHNPEFTMCEFYSAYANLKDLIRETEMLICSLAAHCEKAIAKELVSLPPIDMARFTRPFKQIEFVPALEQAMGLRLPKLNAENALAEMLVLMQLTNVQMPQEVPETLPKLLDYLAGMFLEHQSLAQPVFITHHPSCMSPLARSFLCPRTYQLVSARAELFVCGRELANMYEEENSPWEQRRKLALHRNLVNKPGGQIGPMEEAADDDSAPPRRGPAPDGARRRRRPSEEDLLEADLERLEKQGDSCGRSSLLEKPTKPTRDDWVTTPLDRSYIGALDYGLPPTGGWGCGLERLVMLFSGAQRIGDCLSFGTLRNVIGLSATDQSGADDGAEKGESSSEGGSAPPRSKDTTLAKTESPEPAAKHQEREEEGGGGASEAPQ